MEVGLPCTVLVSAWRYERVVVDIVGEKVVQLIVEMFMLLVEFSI